MHDEDDQPRWSIGEVSRGTGITIRTLYHYDEIGLLRPAERTAPWLASDGFSKIMEYMERVQQAR